MHPICVVASGGPSHTVRFPVLFSRLAVWKNMMMGRIKPHSSEPFAFCGLGDIQFSSIVAAVVPRLLFAEFLKTVPLWLLRWIMAFEIEFQHRTSVMTEVSTVPPAIFGR